LLAALSIVARQRQGAGKGSLIKTGVLRGKHDCIQLIPQQLARQLFRMQCAGWAQGSYRTHAGQTGRHLGHALKIEAVRCALGGLEQIHSNALRGWLPGFAPAR
jgi:hypothetical protein